MSQQSTVEKSEEQREGESDGGEVVMSVSGDGVTSDDTAHTEKTVRNGPTDNDDKAAPASSDSTTRKGASQYQLVFMEDLSSESSVTGSLSPHNLESSGTFVPVLPASTVNSTVNSSNDHLAAVETHSIVSSSTTVAESSASSDTVEMSKGDGTGEGKKEGEGGSEGKGKGEGGREGGGEGGRVGKGEGEGEGGREGGGEGDEKRETRGGVDDVDGKGEEVFGQERDIQTTEERNVSPSDVVIDTRSDSVTPSPKPKKHALSRYTNDSDIDITPPFSPVEYHSSEDESGGKPPIFPVMTPSPLPPGATSPDQPAMSILFSGVFYLGSSTVDAPISETEANRKMNILHEQALTSHPMPIILSIPVTNEGSVLLKDPKTDQPLTSFSVKTILFCARGNDATLQDCFCLNVKHKRSGTYHCHVFQCEIMEATQKIFEDIGRAFKSSQGQPASPVPDQLCFEVNIGVEILEDDGKGNFVHVMVDKDCFRLRQNTRKKVTMTIFPTPNNKSPLNVQRCFGILLSPGKDLTNSQMNLLDNMSVEDGDNGSYSVSGFWDVGVRFLSALNETHNQQQYLTVAADLVMAVVNEPVRFKREVKVRVSRGDMLSSIQLGLMPSRNKRKLPPEGFTLILAKVPGSSEKPHYSVVELREGCMPVQGGVTAFSPSHSPENPHRDTHDTGKVVSPMDDQPHPLSSQKKKGGGKTQLSRLREEQEGDSDGSVPVEDGEEDPMVSGWGEEEDMKEDLLKDWGEVLEKWDIKQRERSRPKQISKLCRKGIPYHLRCQLWQCLSGADHDPQLLESYRLLLPQESRYEAIILMDMQRTYLGHNFFHEKESRDSLYKICKAYSIYDDEVGYCQGLSFIIAVLLLQKIPEEQAFAVLIKIMYQYRHRDVFKANFHQLHLMFFQLDRLLKEYMEGLHGHFIEQRVETHMYSSQWFLTIFTIKFPIAMVFRVMDVYLSHGPIVMFQIALAILKINKHDLKALDFEGILNYFRESVPKRFQSEDAVDELFRVAFSFKVKERKLKDLEKEYPAYLEQLAELEDPVKRLERENKHMGDTIMKLEQENEHLTCELVGSKAGLREEMDKLEERIDTLSKEARAHKTATEVAQLLIAELREELQQAKEEYQKVMVQLMEERVQSEATVAEYKQLAQQMDKGHQKQVEELNQELIEVKAQCSIQQQNSTVVEPQVDHPLSEHQATLSSEERLRKLELELAQTKLALVESQCRNQELEKKLEKKLEGSSSSSGRTNRTSFLGRGKKKS